MTRGIHTYTSYQFVDKDPVIDEVMAVIRTSGQSMASISRHSGVTVSTINNWDMGRTKRPQFATVNAIMRTLGYECMWHKK